MLKNIPLFSCLDHDELSALEKIAIQRTYQKNTVLISEGDTGNSLYVVCKGKANAVGTDPDGKQIILNSFGPGDYFGEMSFIDGEPISATVETKKLPWC
ncbi:MAG: cyclic nucleotide-binding domain-containing protein [Desulfobacteraceae bacterium]|nr:cyclic nucleotide-binding domain-containing protein [Desulfobacteraceae bacterium]